MMKSLLIKDLILTFLIDRNNRMGNLYYNPISSKTQLIRALKDIFDRENNNYESKYSLILTSTYSS